MDRRDFLKVILATGIAPAIVRAESLMKIYVPKKELIVLERPSPVIAPEWFLKGRSSTPSYTDIKAGGTEKIRVDGVEYSAYKRIISAG